MRKLISRIFGAIADTKFPKFIQIFINEKYVNFFKIDMSEFENLRSFPTLNALFTRKLIKPRQIPSQKDALICPVDSEILSFGKAQKTSAISIKGREYEIDELLDESFENCEFEYVNFYLSPRDYHHYHAPCDLQILSALYIPGALKSVAKSALLKTPNLYAKNERVILKCVAKNGKFIWLVFVGAQNVGRMKFDFDESIKTNAKNGLKFERKYENLHVKIGEHLGNFELGSTLVLLAQSGAIEIVNDKNIVKFSEILGKIKF